jgi:hypothetical protein
MSETLDYIKTFVQFPSSLRRFLSRRLTPEQARQIVRERMERREENFLRLVERSVYGYARSPYLWLLKQARYEMGDLRRLVKQKQLDGALLQLREEGVYVTFEELKGRRPIVRNGNTIEVNARDFDNPFARRDIMMQTGGSTGVAMSVGLDLDYVADTAPHHLLTLSAHHVLDAPLIAWSHVLPGHGIRSVVQWAQFGVVPQRWFSPSAWHDSKYRLKYGLATYYILAWMRLNGLRVPMPEYIGLDQALRVARWVSDVFKTHGRCLLHTGVSRTVRVCLAAQQAGLDLSGLTVRGGGEPVTPAKAEVMRRSGLHFVPGYGMTEANIVGTGCAQPSEVGDVHLFKDAFALFSYPYDVPGIGVRVPAFVLSSLLDTAPKIMFNVQVDDYGLVEDRTCGCELESYGYTTHLREIRSYSKLVGEGVTLIGNEMLKILEEVLPAHFGGSPLDYQLMEQEDERGFTRLCLMISPSVEIADESLVIDRILKALRDSSPMADAARTVWQQAQSIQIKRAEPVWNARARLMPLHIPRQKSDS